MRKLDWTMLTTSGNTRDLTSRLRGLEDQLADAITDGDAWEGVDEGHPFANVISAKNGLLDLIRDVEAGEVTVALRENDKTPMQRTVETDKTGAAAMLRDALGDLFETADGMDEGDHNRESILYAMSDIQRAFDILFVGGGGATKAERKGSVLPYKLDTIDAAMTAIDKLNAMAWLLIDAFDNDAPSDSIVSGIHAMLTESTDELETFVREVRNNTRTDSNALK